MVTFSFPEALAAGLALILTTAAVTYWLTSSPGMGTLPEAGSRTAESRPAETSGTAIAGEIASFLGEEKGPDVLESLVQVEPVSEAEPVSAAEVPPEPTAVDDTVLTDLTSPAPPATAAAGPTEVPEHADEAPGEPAAPPPPPAGELDRSVLDELAEDDRDRDEA